MTAAIRLSMLGLDRAARACRGLAELRALESAVGHLARRWTRVFERHRRRLAARRRPR